MRSAKRDRQAKIGNGTSLHPRRGQGPVKEGEEVRCRAMRPFARNKACLWKAAAPPITGYLRTSPVLIALARAAAPTLARAGGDRRGFSMQGGRCPPTPDLAGAHEAAATSWVSGNAGLRAPPRLWTAASRHRPFRELVRTSRVRVRASQDGAPRVLKLSGDFHGRIPPRKLSC